MPEPKLNTDAPRVIRVACPTTDVNERGAVAECFDREQFSAGPAVAAFETEFAARHHCAFGVACNSGGSALHLALEALELPKGSPVAVPAMTMVAVPNMVRLAGYEPIFVDSESLTGNVCPAALARAVADGCAAAVVAHLYGMPFNDKSVLDDGLGTSF